MIHQQWEPSSLAERYAQFITNWRKPPYPTEWDYGKHSYENTVSDIQFVPFTWVNGDNALVLTVMKGFPRNGYHSCRESLGTFRCGRGKHQWNYANR